MDTDVYISKEAARYTVPIRKVRPMVIWRCGLVHLKCFTCFVEKDKSCIVNLNKNKSYRIKITFLHTAE